MEHDSQLISSSHLISSAHSDSSHHSSNLQLLQPTTSNPQFKPDKMKFSAAIAVAFATLFTSVYSAPTMDIEARAPEALESATGGDMEKRQGVVTVQAQVSISMVVVLGTTWDQVRVHTGNINNTLSTINGDSNWVVRNNAIMAVRSELTSIGSILAATTSQIGTLGGNIGGDLNAVAYATLRIAYEVIYTIQFAVNRLGAGKFPLPPTPLLLSLSDCYLTHRRCHRCSWHNHQQPHERPCWPDPGRRYRGSWLASDCLGLVECRRSAPLACHGFHCPGSWIPPRLLEEDQRALRWGDYRSGLSVAV